jgi:hypothetical protein
MLFSSPVQVILHDGAINDGHSSRRPISLPDDDSYIKRGAAALD